MKDRSMNELLRLIAELEFCGEVSKDLIKILTDATHGNEEALQTPIESVFRDLMVDRKLKKVIFDFCKLADLDKNTTQDRGVVDTDDRHKEASSSSSSKKRCGRARRWLIEQLNLEAEFDSKLKIESPAGSSSKDKRKEKNQETDKEIDIESLEKQHEEEKKVIASRIEESKDN